MCDCNQIETSGQADNLLEDGMQKLLFLSAAIRGDGVADGVLGFDAACGLADILKQIALDIDAVREWQHKAFQQPSDAERVKGCGTSAAGATCN